MKSKEIKPIKGYDGMYFASKDGYIYSSKRGVLVKMTPNKDKYGYLRIGLCRNGCEKKYRVHQLVAMAFLNHTPKGHDCVVDHINEDKSDNRLCNLQIISNRANINKSKRKGSSRYRGVSYYSKLNKWRAKAYINGKHRHLGYFNSEEEASNAYEKSIKYEE